MSFSIDNTVTIGAFVSFTFTDTSGSVNKVTTGGKTISNFTFSGTGGRWQLQDPLTMSGTLTLSAGTLDFNSQSFTASAFNSSSGTTILNPGPLWTFSSTLSLSFGATLASTWPAKMLFNGASGSPTTFTGGGSNFNAIEISGTDSFTFTDADNFTSLVVDAAAAARTLTFFNSGTYTIGSMKLNGSAGHLLTVVSSSGGTPATLVGTGGQPFVCDYISLQDNHLSGVQGLVGPNSTLVSGNSGWSVGAFLSAATNIKLSGVASPTARAVLAASGKIAAQARGAAHAATLLAASGRVALQARGAMHGSTSLAAATAIKVRGAGAATYATALAARTTVAVVAVAAVSGATSLAASCKIAVQAHASAARTAFLAASTHIQVRGTAAVTATTALGARTSAAVSARAARLGVALSGSTSIAVFARAMMKLFRPSPRVAITTFQSRTVVAPFQSRTAVAPAQDNTAKTPPSA